MIAKVKASIKELKTYSNDIAMKYNELRDIASKSNEYQVIAKYDTLRKSFTEKEKII